MPVTPLTDRIGKKIGLDLRYLFRNGHWMTLRFAVVSLTGFVFSYAFAHYGSKVLLGQYQLVLSILSLVSLCSFLGLNAAALEAVVHGRLGAVLRAVKLIFGYSLLGIPILLVIAAVYASVRHDVAVAQALILAAPLFPFFYALGGWSVFYEGQLRFRAASLRIMLLSVAQTALLLLGIFWQVNLLGLVAIYLGTSIAFQAFFYREIFAHIPDRDDQALDVGFGIRISIQKFVAGLASNLPPLVISHFFGVELLAEYFIAFFVISALSSFFGSLINLYVPLLFRDIKLHHQSIFMNNLLGGILIWAFFLVFLKFLFLRLYGPAYSGSLELAYRLSFLLWLIPLHTYLMGFFSTRKRNALLIEVFCGANLAGLLSVWLFRSSGFFVAVPVYLYTLECVTTISLLVMYVWLARQPNPGSTSVPVQKPEGEE